MARSPTPCFQDHCSSMLLHTDCLLLSPHDHTGKQAFGCQEALCFQTTASPPKLLQSTCPNTACPLLHRRQRAHRFYWVCCWLKKSKAMLKGTQEVHCCRNVCLLVALGYGSWHLWGSLWVPQTLYSSFHWHPTGTTGDPWTTWVWIAQVHFYMDSFPVNMH